MRKRNLFCAAYLAMGAAMALTSCSNDDDVLNGGNNGVNNGTEPVQTISVQVANAGDNFATTRSSRPLYSAQADQNIDYVNVVIYRLDDDGKGGNNGINLGDNSLEEALKKDNEGKLQAAINSAMYGQKKKIVAQKRFDSWMTLGVSNVYETNGHGRVASWSLSGDNLIKEPGVYAAYAIGYNIDEYTDLTSWHSLAKGGEVSLPLTVSANKNNAVKEIFAGSTFFEVAEDKITISAEDREKEGTPTNVYSFNETLTLHRQVAGTFGYFINIPTKGNADNADVEGKYLRLVASGNNTKAIFGGFNSSFKGNDNGKTNSSTADNLTGVQYVVNGSTTGTKDAKFYSSAINDAYLVYEIELAKWFTGEDSETHAPKMDTNEDGLLNQLDTWTNAINSENTTEGGMTVKEGSVLGSSFLIPFELIDNTTTFQLQMLDKVSSDNSAKIIRYWNVRIPAQDNQIGTETVEESKVSKVQILGENAALTRSTKTESDIVYSIVRNHLYGIGIRMNDDGENKPGTDDKPQSLDQETLILKVNDNWELIHQMEID